MAQVVDHYDSTLAYRGYIYDERTISSTRTQYEPGTTLWIYANADGSVKMLDGFYHCTRGWAPVSICTTPTPSYTTVADTCTPPTSVTLNTSTKVLTVTGGAGGDLNAFTGYKLQYRQKELTAGAAWGAWTDYAALIEGATTRTVAVPAGRARQFRACTTGLAGAAYYSAYVTCTTILNGNIAPGAPTISRPAASAVAVTQVPTIVMSCPAEPDGGTQKLQRKLDSGAWADVKAVAAAGGTVYDALPTLAAGSHTASYRLTDAYGASGGMASVTFTVTPKTWARTISAGMVISNAEISHRADIAELLAAVNAVRAWYGLAAITLPGTVGAFAAWKEQMEALQAGLTAAHLAAGKASPTWAAVPGYPTAAIINAIRARLA